MLRGTVLLADDCSLARQILQLHLVKLNFAVITVENGLEVFNALQDIAPILIITDLNMPLMNGREVAYNLSSSIYKHIPLIFYTTAPMVGYETLLKPLSMDQLKSVLRKIRLDGES